MKKYGFPEDTTEIENINKNNRNPSWSIKNKKIKKKGDLKKRYGSGKGATKGNDIEMQKGVEQGWSRETPNN